jgi:tryptophan-rich sensory protein
MGVKHQRWLPSLSVIVASCAVGATVTILTKLQFPFWVLLASSVAYCAERWFNRETTRHRTTGKVYRVFLNVFVLFLVGAIIWTAVQTFSQRLGAGPLVGALLIIGELALFIWMWKVVARNSWRWPSLKLTVVAAVIISAIAAFAGVSPFDAYKDTVVHGTSQLFAGIGNRTTGQELQPTTTASVASSREEYLFLQGGWKTGNLRTVGQWTGTDSRDISFKTGDTPWVLNAGYSPTSQIRSSFTVTVIGDALMQGTTVTRFINPEGVETAIVQQKGAFTIRVTASGARWWVRVGVE